MSEPSGERKLSVADWIIATLFAATIVVVTAQVVWRYVFNDSLIWTEELSRYLFTWMTFVGAALAIREATHIRITALTDRLPPTARKWLRLATLALIVAFLAYMVLIGFRWVRLNADTRTPALGLPLNYVLYAALPVASLLGVGFGIRRIVALLRERPEREAQ
jgi:TRAP-type C4-dicarboxylate transport system permease small subunit